MEIKQEFKSGPAPTLADIKPGEVFIVSEKGLHEADRVAYMKLMRQSIDDAYNVDTPVVRLSDGKQMPMRVSRQVLPVKAVLTLEVPFG